MEVLGSLCHTGPQVRFKPADTNVVCIKHRHEGNLLKIHRCLRNTALGGAILARGRLIHGRQGEVEQPRVDSQSAGCRGARGGRGVDGAWSRSDEPAVCSGTLHHLLPD